MLSSSLLPSSPLLSTLHLMGNDITTVAEDVLEGLHALRELNLAGEKSMKLLGYVKQFLILKQ